MKKCLICDKHYKVLYNHITKYHNISAKEYYDEYISTNNKIPKCKNCNNMSEFLNTHLRYSDICRECRYKKSYDKMSIESKNKFHESGNDIYFKRLKKEGKFKDFQKNASNKFWGNLTEEQKSKQIRSNLKRMYYRKDIEIDGIKIDNLQGYEHHAIRYLVEKEKYNIRDIKVKPKYIRMLDGKLYYPDFKIGDTIVEVKSTNTLKRDKKINLKKESVLALGFNFRLMIFNKSHLLNDFLYNSL